MATETRLDRVEGELAEVTSRLRRLELGAGVRPEPEAPVDPRPAPKAPAEQALWEPPPLGRVSQPLAKPQRSAFSALDFEQLFGGRVLAWIGGLAMLFAAVLFVGMAVSRGWINEEARTLIAAVAALALAGAGVWLHERHGRTEAAQAAVAAGISGLFATIVVATKAYDLIPPELGLALGATVAAAGFAIAVRWDAPVVAAVGSLGAICAPPLVGVGAEDSVGFVLVALAATVAILVWRRWDWLALGAFLVSAPQLAVQIFGPITFEGETSSDLGLGAALALLLAYWALYTVAAVGYQLRSRSPRDLPVSSWLLLFASCALVVGDGHDRLVEAGAATGAVVWLFGFAGVYLALGALVFRLRVHRELGALSIGLGLALTAFGLAAALDGPALVAAWAAVAAVLAALSTRLEATPDPALSSRQRLLAVAAVFLGLAVCRTLIVEAPPAALFEGVDDLGSALAAIAACAGGAFVLARCLRDLTPDGARAAVITGATALVYLGSVLIVDTLGVDAAGEVRQAGQVWLSAFWTVTGLAAVVFGLIRRQGSVRLAGLALLGAAIVKVWTYDLAELEELARVLSFVGLGLLLLAGAFAYGRIKPAAAGEEPEAREERVES
jgi:predicted membrane protein DUF2339